MQPELLIVYMYVCVSNYMYVGLYFEIWYPHIHAQCRYVEAV